LLPQQQHDWLSLFLSPSPSLSLSVSLSLCVCVKYANVLPNLIWRCYPARHADNNISNNHEAGATSLEQQLFAWGHKRSFYYMHASLWHVSCPRLLTALSFVPFVHICNVYEGKQGNSIFYFLFKLFTYSC